MSEYDDKGQIDRTRYVRESVAVPKYTREYTHVEKADDWTPTNKKGVHRTVRELVHIHHLYRRVDAKGNATQERWFRGARVS